MPKLPPKSKNPVGGHRQGSKKNNPPREKEVDVSNVITFPKTVNLGAPKQVTLVCTARIVPFVSRNAFGRQYAACVGLHAGLTIKRDPVEDANWREWVAARLHQDDNQQTQQMGA